MGYVKVISVPWGEAPLEIRAGWFGLILPVIAIHDMGCFGVLTNQHWEGTMCSVPQDEALEVLSKVRPETATWWKERGYPKLSENFCFRTEEVEIIGQLVDIEMMIACVLGESSAAKIKSPDWE